MIALKTVHSSVACLECPVCRRSYAFNELHTYATCCNEPLLTRYEFASLFHKSDLLFREHTMWRYYEVLPVLDEANIVSLGEGMTPMRSLEKLGDRLGFTDLMMKDESYNPTGSFKARGLSVAISKAKEFGITHCVIPTAGNAGAAAAAYCAKADIECTVIMPRDTPDLYKQEVDAYGAELILVDGLINDCGAKAKQLQQQHGYFDLSTLKEPYRLEGKKTMGYEIAEQYNWQLPDVILYPAGGGTGLIGIWKAFEEMLKLRWIMRPLPRMIAVQSEVCDPVVRAFSHAGTWKDGFKPEMSVANGLSVPYPFGMNLMQRVLQESDGLAVRVSEASIKEMVKTVARTEGLLLAPEGAATIVALTQLERSGLVHNADRVLVMNTGTGLKNLL